MNYWTVFEPLLNDVRSKISQSYPFFNKRYLKNNIFISEDFRISRVLWYENCEVPSCRVQLIIHQVLYHIITTTCSSGCHSALLSLPAINFLNFYFCTIQPINICRHSQMGPKSCKLLSKVSSLWGNSRCQLRSRLSDVNCNRRDLNPDPLGHEPSIVPFAQGHTFSKTLILRLNSWPLQENLANEELSWQNLQSLECKYF